MPPEEFSKNSVLTDLRQKEKQLSNSYPVQSLDAPRIRFDDFSVSITASGTSFLSNIVGSSATTPTFYVNGFTLAFAK
jgi:hypothetical protein